MRVARGAAWAGIGVGAVLLAATTLGLFLSFDERPRVGDAPAPPERLEAFYRASDAAFTRLGPSTAFLREVVTLYDDTTSFRAPGDFAVDFRDNWMLWAAQFAEGALNAAGVITVDNFFSHYQSTRYDRAIERGIGHCSAHALALGDLLTSRYGLDADVLGLGGHVVVAGRAEGREVVLDPSLGLYIEASLDAVERDLSIVEAAYASTDYPQLAAVYDRSGNQRFAGGAAGYNPRMYRLERLTDILKFALPVALLLLSAGALALCRPRRAAG